MRCHGTSSACASHVHTVFSHISAAFRELIRCYAGAVCKRFVIYNNHYFEYFQALNFDNLVESKFQLCHNENKVSFSNQWISTLISFLSPQNLITPCLCPGYMICITLQFYKICYELWRIYTIFWISYIHNHWFLYNSLFTFSLYIYLVHPHKDILLSI